MSLADAIFSRLGRPAGKALDPTIRDIVHTVLKEHGYASPAEVQALRDEVRDMRSRVDGMDRRLAEVVKLADDARTEAAAARDAADARTAPAPQDAELVARVAELERALAAATASPAARASAAAPHAPGACRVEGCENPKIRSRGLCNPHYLKWLRGTLHGFVGPEGQIELGGKVHQLSARHAAGKAELREGRVWVDGQPA